jgi:Sulfotransferase family
VAAESAQFHGKALGSHQAVFISHKYRAIFVHIQRTGGNSVQKIFEQNDPGLVETIAIAPAANRTKHCYATDLAAAVDRDVFAGYTKFCVVRNPFDRMVSWYAHFQDGGNREDAGVKPTRDSRVLQVFHRGRVALAGRPALLRAYTRAWAGMFRAIAPGSPAEVSLRFEAIGERVMGEVNRHAPDFTAFVQLPRDHPGGVFERLHVNQLDYVSGPDGLLIDRVLRFESLAGDFAALAQALGFPGRLPHLNASSRHPPYREWYTPATREAVASRFARDCAHFGYAF